jgi:hypothetical protein
MNPNLIMHTEIRLFFYEIRLRIDILLKSVEYTTKRI